MILFFLILTIQWAVAGTLPEIQSRSEQMLEFGSMTPEELLSMRDPFSVPPMQKQKMKQLSDLERFPLDSLKVIGILTGPDRFRALILSPEGKTYSVGEKTKIGQEGGIVHEILPQKVLVQQKTMNLVGQTESTNVELKLLKEGESVGTVESTSVSNTTLTVTHGNSSLPNMSVPNVQENTNVQGKINTPRSH